MSRPLLPATIGALCAATLLVGGATTAASASPPAPPTAGGTLVLIGGALKENAEILQRIVELGDPDGDGPESARIALITAAAAPARTPEAAANPTLNNASANGLYYGDLFAQYGADTYAVPIDGAVNYEGDPYTPANAYDEEVAAQVRASTGVFFGGGDQMRYIRTLLECSGNQPLEAHRRCVDTPVLAAVREVLERGGVVAGVSAGLTAQQGPDMITGGESYQAWRDGATPGYLDDVTELGFVPHGGLGFFPEGLLDSHFTTWGRQARAIKLAADTRHERVVGVDETTALVYDRDTRTAEVIGEHGVSLLTVSKKSVKKTTATDVRWSLLVAGDRVDFASGAITPGAERVTGPGAGPSPEPATDVWDSRDGDGGIYTLRDLARALVASAGSTAVGTTVETGPQFRTTLIRDARTSWWSGGGFENLRLDIAPVE
jgi:cyanophycinase